MELVGQIEEIFDEKQITAKLRKRSIVIKTNEKYPQHVEVEFVNDRINLLDAIAIGQQVTISFNVRGRKWAGPKGDRYFVSIDGWRIQAANTGGDSYPAPTGGGRGGGGPNPNDDDIPFFRTSDV